MPRSGDVRPQGGSRIGAQHRVEPLGVVVLIVALSLTAALTLTAQSLYNHSEHRLLVLRLREAGAVLGGALPAIQTPLVSAATLGAATAGDPSRFRRFMTAYVGPRGPFVSGSLWTVRGRYVRRVATIGEAPLLASTASSKAKGLLVAASASSSLNVSRAPAATADRLGYAVGERAGAGAYVAYGESALPAHAFSRIPPGAAFSDLNYALYLGRSEQPSALLETNVTHLPLRGTRAALQIPLGDAALDLVMSPRVPLSGTLFEWRGRMVAGVGAVVSLIAGLLAHQLVRRRRTAEELAARLDTLVQENRQLYREERTTSLTLQNALLPRGLPDVAGLDVAGRYVAAVTDMAIGGDWYDIISLDDRRTLFVIGDVSGHGVNAATGMAALRYAIRAWAGETSSPAVMIEKLGRLLHVEHDHQLATVLCGVIDSERHEMTIASAGHPPPLLIEDGRREFVTSEHGPPVGVGGSLKARDRTVPLRPQATVLAYTDGLIERRGESLDAGLARLLQTVQPDLPLEALLDAILHDVAPEGGDDIALLGIRYAPAPAQRDLADGEGLPPIDSPSPVAERAT